MGGYLDIIVFAVIAVALLWRLRSVLGERSEDDVPSIQSPVVSAAQIEANVQSQIGNTMIAQSPVNWAGNLPNYDIVETATAHQQLVPFLTVDPDFRPDDFIHKARRAYGIIVTAFAKGDKKTLEFLLAPPLYKAFAEQIDARFENNETYDLLANDLKKALVHRADLSGTTARVTVDFTALQSITHKDKDGRYLAGEDGRPEMTVDRWIFEKNLKSSDPKWILVQTEDLDG